MSYSAGMIDVIQSDTFRRWIAALQDQRAVARINARVRRLSEGNAGAQDRAGVGGLKHG